MNQEANSTNEAIQPVGRKSRRSSVILKITMSVIAVVVLALTAITLLGERAQRAMAENTYSVSATAITKLIAAGETGSIRFKKAKIIQGAYDDLVADKADWVDGFFALDRSGNAIFSRQSERAEKLEFLSQITATLEKAEAEPVTFAINGRSVVVAPTGVSKKDGKPYGYLAIAWNKEFISDAIAGGRMNNIVAGVFGVVMIVGLLFVVIQWQVTGPLARITACIQTLAAGNQDLEIPERGRNDEIGSIADALGVLRKHEIERHHLARDQEEASARREKRQTRTEELVTKFKSEVQALLETVIGDMTDMDGTATGLTELSDNTAEQATSAATATEQASSNVNSVASSAEELSASIAEISRQLESATHAVAKGTSNAELSNTRVAGLTDAADKIGEVITLIQKISEQTHLLALNATIEAARAGEMGKGFAVVASEVKTLANETAQATEEISEHITAIQESTADAVSAIDAIGASMTEINDLTNSIATSVQEQGDATSEISRSSQEAAAGTREMASTMVAVNEAVANTRMTAGEVKNVSGNVSAQAAKLKSVINAFLDEVAAA